MAQVRTLQQHHPSLAISAGLHAFALLLLSFTAASSEVGRDATLRVSRGETGESPQLLGLERVELEVEEPDDLSPEEVALDVAQAALVEPEIPAFNRLVVAGELSIADLDLSVPLATTAAQPPAYPLSLAAQDDRSGRSERGAERGTEGRDGSDSRGTFFGHPLSGERVVFVLDCSGSMASPAGVRPDGVDESVIDALSREERREWIRARRKLSRTTRWERLVDELSSALRSLDEGVAFSIILFSDGYWEINGSIQVASSPNKEKAIRWIETLRVGRDTYPFPALQHALGLSPDVIYFLTDGDFDASVIKNVTWLNQRLPQPATIHTVGLGSLRDHHRLVNLAKHNGGEFLLGR